MTPRLNDLHWSKVLVLARILPLWSAKTKWNDKVGPRYYIQGVPKKMSFLGKRAITTFKIIQNAKAGGVLENSGYLLPDEH